MAKTTSHTKKNKRGCSSRISSKLSRSRSLNARKQRRNPDGTFAKGFKKSTTSKKSPSTSKNNAPKTNSKPGTSSVKRNNSTSGKKSSSSTKGYTPKMYQVEKAFDFECNSTTKNKVIKVVSDNFTSEEIKKISKKEKPVINNDVSLTKNKRNAYNRKVDDKKDQPVTISFINNPNESTITHEVIHHLRTVDNNRTKYAKTAYPVDKNGVLKRKKIHGSDSKKVSNAEETATVVETELRTKKPSKTISKYWTLDGNTASGKVIRDSDRSTVRSTKTGTIKEGTNATGKRAVDAVNENYPKTLISSRKIGDETALETFRKIFNKRDKRRW